MRTKESILRHGILMRKTPLKLVTRYVLAEVAAPSALALSVILFLGVIHELRERRKVLNVAFIQLWDIVRLTAYLTPTLVYYVVPIAYMMGILLAFGRLAQQNEVTAVRAAGIPLKRIVLPVILGGAMLSAACFVVQDWIQPAALRKANELIYIELPKRLTLETLPTGVVQTLGDWRVYVGSRDDKTRTLKEVEILVPKGDKAGVYYAESATLLREEGRSSIVMRNGHVFLPEEGNRVSCITFNPAVLSVPDTPAIRIPNQRRMLTLRELYAMERFLSLVGELHERGLWDDRMADDLLWHQGRLAEIARIPDEIKESRRIVSAAALAHVEGVRNRRTSDLRDDLHKTRTEIGDRLSLPLACLAVSFVAAPLGARARASGRTYGFAIGSAICLIYYVLWSAMSPRTLHSFTEAIIRSQAPNVLLLAAGVWCLWRVDRV